MRSAIIICVLLPLLVNSSVISTNKSVKDFEYLGTGQRDGQPNFRYYLSNYSTNQAVAAADCQNFFNGNLVSILNALEDQNINTILEAALPSGFIHTSGVRETVGAPFIWKSMTPPLPATHFKWAPGAPNSLPASMCINVGRSVGVYQWYADNCAENHKFICEI